jgi:hypothetical protein
MMLHAAVVVLVGALLAACSPRLSGPPPQLEAKLIIDLRGGHADLTCGAACSGTWSASLAALNQRYAAEDWRHLATQVMWIGYQNDLAYYYLGRRVSAHPTLLGSIIAKPALWRLAGTRSSGAMPAATTPAMG